jgi:plastocyanin
MNGEAAMLKRSTTGLAVLLAAGLFGVGIGAMAGSVSASTAHKVSMAGSRYAPTAIAARVGDTIRFDNDDFENHWVYVPTAGYQVSRAGQKPGETFDIVVRKAGTFIVLCGLHTQMEAKVIVSP